MNTYSPTQTQWVSKTTNDKTDRDNAMALRRITQFLVLLLALAVAAHDALEHMANSICPGLLLWLLVHGLGGGSRVGAGSSFLGTLPGSVSLLDVDNLILAQRSRVACTTSAPLKVLLGFAAGARVRLDVLGLACDVRVHIRLHVALAASAGSVRLGFDGRGLEVGGLKVGRGRRHVAC